MSADGDVARLAGMIRSAGGRMVVLTGAGVSTESGLPDFRSEGGRWTITDWQQTATAEVAQKHPERVWEFTSELVSELGSAAPNDTHRVLADWERRGLVSLVATQNIDGLHQAAGSRMVVELHGTLREAACTSCETRLPMDDALALLESSPVGYPVCTCGAALRPAIVLFDEVLPYWEWKQASRLITGGETRLVLCLGTSLMVRPVADLPGYARQAGAQVAIINRGETGYDDPGLHDVLIRAPLGETMTALNRLLDSSGGSPPPLSHRRRAPVGRRMLGSRPWCAADCRSGEERLCDHGREMSGDKRELFEQFGRLGVVGYWLPSADPVAVDVHEAIDPTWDETERALVVGYLIHAPFLCVYMGVNPCRLCDCRENGSAELTDGTYRWPEGFAHYLVHHRVRPPDHFVEHVLANAHLVEAWNAEPGHEAITVRDPAYPWRFRWKRLSSGIILRSGSRPPRSP